MLERVSKGPQRIRTLFLSDIHLGTKGCQADKLLDFLRHYEAETVYLVGDIVDGWQLKSGWYWPQSHNDVVQKLLRQARKGVRLRYIPGNHDEFLRDYYGTHFGGIEVLRGLGLTYWSLSQWAKLKVKNAVNFIGEYENTLAAEAQRRGRDLRPHSPRGDSQPGRHVLHQLRRLGGKLHGGGRAFQRHFRNRPVDRARAAARRARARNRAAPNAAAADVAAWSRRAWGGLFEIAGPACGASWSPHDE